jgi:hypothetical protein
MIGVRRLELGHAQQKTTYPRFVGQIGNDLPFKSIEGMSGGVIFGFQTKPRLRYWIVAIQSSWERQTRTVYGCSLPVLASLMTHWARENVAILRELDANSAEICLSAPNATPPTEHLIPTAKALSEGGLLLRGPPLLGLLSSAGSPQLRDDPKGCVRVTSEPSLQQIVEASRTHRTIQKEVE